jgi:hypothetical protein
MALPEALLAPLNPSLKELTLLTAARPGDEHTPGGTGEPVGKGEDGRGRGGAMGSRESLVGAQVNGGEDWHDITGEIL